MLIVTIIVASVALFSFKSSTTARKYGGSGSVKIDIFGKNILGDKGEKKSTITLNATVSCFEYDAAAVKEKLQKELEYQARNKINALKETWEYAGEIDYRINSCD